MNSHDEALKLICYSVYFSLSSKRELQKFNAKVIVAMRELDLTAVTQ